VCANKPICPKVANYKYDFRISVHNDVNIYLVLVDIFYIFCVSPGTEALCVVGGSLI
jgi:hypothetical protein